jgi:D-galactarolactone cycloisomerase
MKITGIKTFVVSQALGEESFAYSQAWYDTRTILLLKMETDEGLVGWGEAFGFAAVNKAIIDNVYAPLVLGRDPFDSEVIWEELYNRVRDHGQKGMSVEASSAIDIALWDIKKQRR